MKKTFLILLVLLCVAAVGIASASAAGDDIASDDAIQSSIDDNSIEEIISDETEDSISDSVAEDMDDSDVKSLGANNLGDGTTIYVSTTGNDANDGSSEENAVATISHAVEIAGDGSTINIAKGEYTSSAIDIPESKSLSFIGAEKDGVTIKGTGNYFVGLIESGSSLTFKNLIISGIDSTNGQSTGIRVGGDSPLEISNCTFTNINAKYGALWVYTSNVAKVTDCTFKDVSCSVSGGAGALYVTNGNVSLDRCIFDGVTYSKESGYMYGAIYQTNGNLTISNSLVTNVDAYASALLRTSKLNTFIRNTTFIKNVVRPNPNNYNNYGDAILKVAGASAYLTVEGCNFIENQAKYGVIHVERTFANISYSSFIDNTNVAGGGNLLLINATSAQTKEVHANYNFYGTNDNPSNLVSDVDIDNWVIMTASSSADSVAVGDEITITADFSKYTDGTNMGDVTGTMAEIPVKFANDNTKGSLSEIAYEDNKAIVTYTGVAEGDDSVAVSAASVSTTIPITVTSGSGPSGNVIYVKEDGNDENDGLSEATAVATIARAVEIVDASQGTDFTILVSNGNYYISKIESPEAKNVNLIGESRDGVILHASGTYGINVYEDDVSWNIEKVTVCDLNNTAGTSAAVRFLGNGTSSMNDCAIKNITAKYGALYLNTKGTVNISNTLIENIYGSTASGASSIYVYDSGTFHFDNIEVSGCTLDETVAGTSTAYYLRAVFYVNDYYATINLFNSRIIDNVGPIGAIIESRAKFNVINTTIANNYVKTSTNGNNGGEYLIWASHDNSVINVSNSVIANNTLGKSTKGVFYAQKGSTNVEYSAIYNNLNSDESAAGLISGSLITADYDWWGTNERPSSSVDKWVIMNVDPTSKEGIEIGDTVAISVDFNHYTDSTGTVYDLEGRIPELAVTATATAGSLDKAEAITENGQASFVYTAAAGGEDTVNIASGAATVPIAIVVNMPIPPHDVYVSKDGNDENNGEEETPVATIAKAIEIATSDVGTGKIFIKEGTYTETGFTVSKDLSITGIGNVVIDANNVTAKMFTIAEAVSSFELKNVEITKANQNYGAVLYNYYTADVVFDNVSISESYANGWSGSALIVSKGSLTINNSNISNNGPISALILNNGGKLTINNTAFENNVANTTSSCNGAIESTGNAVVTIENSNFTNIGAVRGAVYSGASDTGSLSIIGSNFENCTALLDGSNFGYGGAVHSQVALAIDKSTFKNSKSYRDGAAVYVTKDATITNSVFMGGDSQDGDTAEIYVTGKLILNNNILIKSSDDKYLVKASGTVDAKNNYWGSNSPSALVSGFTLENWVIMDVNPAVTQGNIGEAVEITVDFKHTSNPEGTINDLEGGLPQELTVYAQSANGTFRENPITTNNLIGKVVFTPEFAGENIVNLYTDINNKVPVTVVVAEPYTGPIYVSKDGSDSNSGKEDAPVATIAKAVELAQAGSGQVIIKEGSYNENNITINSEIPLTITGEDNVVIDGTGLGTSSMFIIKTSQAIVFKNIKFANNKAKYGAAIDMEGSRSGLLPIDVTIDSCVFEKLEATSQGGAIYITYTSGKLLFNNTAFTKNNASSWGGALAVTYSAYESALDLVINNTSFSDNFGNNAGGAYLMANTITIENSNFTHNGAKYYPGALELYNCTAIVDNCIFTDNNASKQSAAIKVEGVKGQPITTASITNTIIENNVGLSEKAAAVYVDKSTVEISYSSIVNEHNLETVTSTGYDAVYGQGMAIVNNNWWGTNDPSTKVNGTNITMDNWVIMNAAANATDVLPGDEVKVTVDFNHVMTSAGEIEELTGGVIPKEAYTVSFTAENGTVSPETLTINKGESGNAVFTASDSNSKVTVSCGDATAEIVFEEAVDPYTGIVYVSPDGSDSNNGSAEAPVASIAKAIAIATAPAGSGQIVIKEGTYKGSGYQVTKDLTITGEGNVVIDGEGQGRLFNVSDGTAKFSLANVTLTGANHGYGAAVYSFAKETLLDNVTIINNPGAGDLITTYGNLTIKDSEVSGHNGGDVIQTSGDATIIINNSLFKDNDVTASTSDYGILYVSSGKSNVIVENSKFYNNKARQGIVIGSNDANITVKGSEFINNTNTVSYGGAIRASAKLDVTESIFINNKANRDGGAIYIGWRGDATITKSEFINNSAGGNSYHGDAIYNGNKATVNYCILLTNASNYLIYNDGEDNIVNAQYNWWGTNDNPKSLNGYGTYEDDYGYDEIDCAEVDCSNWIVMNVAAETSDVKAGAEVPITVDFNHYLDNATGEVKDLADKLAQELTVDFSTITGSLDKNAVETVDLVAQATYTAVEGDNKVTVKSGDAEVNIEFNAVKSIPTSLSVPEEITVTVGEGSFEVTLTAEGSPVEGKVVSVKVNDEITINSTTNAQGIAAIDLSSVPIGTYNAEISFAGETPYEASSASCKIIVKEAPKTAEELQKLIDETPAGGTLNLSNMEFADVSGINITKDIAIVGDNTTISTAGDGTPVFNIPSNVGNVSISGIDFVANNGDVIVKASAANGTDDLSIVNPAIELANNTVSPANENVVPSSITLFELESERAVLAPSNEISISNNNLPEGAKAFDFAIAGLNNGSDVNIPKGGNINTNGSSKPVVKVATKIVAKAMKTTTVNTKINGKKAGKNFSITLKDSKGNVLAKKQVLISFNGKIYKRTTNAKGVATVKVALAKKGTYPVVISFLGDDKYNGSFAVAKVKVNPQKVKLTVAKKKYKASKKKKVLTAKLLASNKKAIKGKKLVFTVNKKKYKAKTNKKGIAKVKVKLSRKKTYKVKVKFAGDSTFKKATKKGKVVIK